MKAWLNGRFEEWENVQVSLLSHSFSRASAIFEVVNILRTVRGPAYFGLREHADRFFNSARLTFMELPLTRGEMIQAHLETARENGIQQGLAKSFAYYPDVEFSVTPTRSRVSVAIFCLDFTAVGKAEELSAPVAAGFSSFRKIHPETIPVHAKATGNYMNPFLSKMEVKKKGYGDAILLDTMGFVAEGPTATLFMVQGKKILTPPLRCVLPGITRSAVIEVLGDGGYVVQERDIRPEELMNCDEAFYCGTVIHIKPIASIEGKALGRTCPGPVTRVAMEKLKELHSGRSEKYRKWFTYL